MKVVITKRETREVRPRYREKYSGESVEILRKKAMQDAEDRRKVEKYIRDQNNNYIFRGKNITDSKPINNTIKRYLGNPDSIISEEKIPYVSPQNPLREVETNVLTLNQQRQLYDENNNIQCAVNPNNLVGPLKVNPNVKRRGEFVPTVLASTEENLPNNIIQHIRALNPSEFDTKTASQNKNSFIPDLLYHEELDRVDSLHNAISHPNSFVPPPVSLNPSADMTHESLTNANYYPINNNFFNKDQFKCYSTTMGLINQMNKEKPAHLKEYDRRMFDGQNIMSLGNVFYNKNEKFNKKETRDQIIQSNSHQFSPERNQGYVTKYDIVVDKATSEGMSPPNSASMKKTRKNILMKHVQNKPEIQIEYHGKLIPSNFRQSSIINGSFPKVRYTATPNY